MKRPKSVGGRQPFDHNAGRQDDADRPELQLWGANPYLRTAYDQLAYASDTNRHAAWPAVAKEMEHGDAVDHV
ncbi:hypothetical protein PAESOLCIP111_02393 [Paenibacillus solanacearum]|uniref:Uncharacterized protein n=1 Tax=Paenibacillus solanacearum TaxID=2048548 RepID=A0A916NJ36_9BACL|nr:hypothetical protein [Paenibacillus solanacearum]CAG7622110.1 hypothetical protein PAESOLCIP111_02393 [Paenibacillus solanacearum]